MNRQLVFILILGVLVFFGCRTKYPITENDCLAEVKQINHLISRSNYTGLKKELNKYETYEKFSIKDLDNKCYKLSDYLREVNLEKLNYVFIRDSLGLDFSDLSQTYVKISCFYDKKEICMYKYLYKKEKRFELTFFNHLLNAKVIPVIPRKGDISK